MGRHRRLSAAAEYGARLEHRHGPARDVDGQQPQRRGRHLADRLVAAHHELDPGTRGSQACGDGPPAVGLAAGGEADQFAGGVRAPHRRRRGGDRADRQRGDQR